VKPTLKSRGKRLAAVVLTERSCDIIDETPPAFAHIIHRKGGGPFLSTQELSRELRRKWPETGARPELHLHDARGTAATRLYLAGNGLREIALRMGWLPTYATRMIDIYCANHPLAARSVARRKEADR